MVQEGKYKLRGGDEEEEEEAGELASRLA